jgi:hypothetical protein
MMRCSKCENIYKLNHSSNKYEILSFISLQMRLEAHFEYDNLSLRYIYKHFRNIDEKEIEQLFYSYKHLLIPTVSHLKVSPLKEKGWFKEIFSSKKEKTEFDEKNIYYLDDLHILNSEERTKAYLNEFNKIDNTLPESEIIIQSYPIIKTKD